MIFNPYTLSLLGIWGRGDSTYRYTYGDRDTIYHPYTLSFWRLGDVGTVPKDIHPEIGTQYTTFIQSHFWRLGDVGTVPKDIHSEIGTQYTTPTHSHFLETLGRGDTTHGYTYGDKDIIYHPYTLSFLETWGQYLQIHIRR